LQNTGAAVLDLSLMQFTRGVTFTFPIGVRLDPGAFCVLGHDAAALEAKHPGLTVQGVFTGQLDNSGETLQLVSGSGATVSLFAFNDDASWPALPDGGGPSLTLRAAGSDPALPANWRPSYLNGGTPGRPDNFSLADWRAAHFSSAELGNPAGEAVLWGHLADPDGDGISNLLEYALGGSSPRDPASVPALTGKLVTDAGQTWLRGTYSVHEGASGITVRAEVSSDLSSGSWQPLTPLSTISQGDNTSLVTVQAMAPLSGSARLFLRVVVGSP
jgi:hypothetical protein